VTIELMGYRRPRLRRLSGKSCGQTNSAAVPLFARKIPLFAGEIPLFDAVAEFPSDPSGINHLQGRIPPATGLNRRILLFFRVE